MVASHGWILLKQTIKCLYYGEGWIGMMLGMYDIPKKWFFLCIARMFFLRNSIRCRTGHAATSILG